MIRGPLLLAAALMGACASFHPSPPAGAPARSTYASVDGVGLRYVEVGQGPAVLLIHGFASSLEVWREVTPVLQRNHRVIALDLKGFGFSGRPEGDYSPRAQARLVLGLMDQLGIDRVSLVAHSWGSGVALAAALEQPARIDKIALYSAYVYDEQVPPFFRWAQIGGLGEALFAMFYQHGLEDRAALAFYDPAMLTPARVQTVIADAERPGAQAAALAAVRGQRYAELARRYPEIGAETLLLWGKDDIVTPIRFGHRLLRELPNARLVEYPRCGHLPMFEAGNASTRELAAFLGGQP